MEQFPAEILNLIISFALDTNYIYHDIQFRNGLKLVCRSWNRCIINLNEYKRYYQYLVHWYRKNGIRYRDNEKYDRLFDYYQYRNILNYDTHLKKPPSKTFTLVVPVNGIECKDLIVQLGEISELNCGIMYTKYFKVKLRCKIIKGRYYYPNDTHFWFQLNCLYNSGTKLEIYYIDTGFIVLVRKGLLLAKVKRQNFRNGGDIEFEVVNTKIRISLNSKLCYEYELSTMSDIKLFANVNSSSIEIIDFEAKF